MSRGLQFCPQHAAPLVHCVVAKRAAAFVFLYRVLRQGVDPEQARTELEAGWTPNEVWDDFIAQQLALGGSTKK